MFSFYPINPTKKKQSKNNFDPSVGVIDTSKWSSSNPGPNSGNGSPGFLNQQSMGPGGLGAMNPGTKLNPNMNGLTNACTPGTEWSANIFNNRVNTRDARSAPVLAPRFFLRPLLG